MVNKTNTIDMLKAWIPIIGVVIALGGGFIKYGEIKTQLKSLSEISAPDLTPLAQAIGDVNNSMAKNQTNIAVLTTEIELLKLQIEEIKISTQNPLQ